jgi:6-phosphofructokinase 1
MLQKKIGILTSGGDCSGLNSIIRAAFLRSKILGYSLIGIKRGAAGIIERPMNVLELTDTICEDSLLTKAGSILLSNSKTIVSKEGKKYNDEECTHLIVEGYMKLGLEGIIYIGGDGSLRIINKLLPSNTNVNMVIIPKTIDNDVYNTDISIGFVTAIEVVTEAINNIRTTAYSHERVFIIEVMGRDTGFIAMYSGIAAGADIILVPEFEFNTNKLLEQVGRCYSSGKNYCIIVVAEAVGANNIASLLIAKKVEVRTVILGHVQRGGTTSVLDKIIGSAFGAKAVDLIDSKKTGVMLSYTKGKIITIPLSELSKISKKRLANDDKYVQTAKSIGVYIGET